MVSEEEAQQKLEAIVLEHKMKLICSKVNRMNEQERETAFNQLVELNAKYHNLTGSYHDITIPVDTQDYKIRRRYNQHD